MNTSQGKEAEQQIDLKTEPDQKCELCGQESVTCASYEFMAGTLVSSEVLSTTSLSQGGYLQTKQLSYAHIIPVVVRVCFDCIEKKVKSEKKTDTIMLIILPVLGFLIPCLLFILNEASVDVDDTLIGVLCLTSFISLAMFFSSVKDYLTTIFKGPNKVDLVQGMTYELAKSKMKEAGRDTLWTPKEYEALKRK